ncbi:hypothetical protein [Catenovulum agarivorans]|uniref:hypothetical protein n=1 Tax=Catenovulum agarivorans TaxID=1172192 RepID=UPI0002DD0AB4|nr:hypothetical protein [Catenovulum agarivorans]
MKLNRFKLYAHNLLVGLSALILSACNQVEIEISNDRPNLTITEINIATDQIYTASDQLHFDYTLVVDDLEDVDVLVDFYLVHAESDGSNDDAVEVEIEAAHHLASLSHDMLSEGHFTYSINAQIPADVTESGKYWLVAQVDPFNEVEEDNEDDNHPNIDNEDHIVGNFPAYELDIEVHPEHEFLFEQVVVDGDLVVLDSPDHHEGVGDHHADIIGHIDAIYHGAEAASAKLTVEVLINGSYQVVSQWDNAQASYQTSTQIDFAYNGDEHFFGFDLALTDEQLQNLYSVFQADADNTLSLRFTLEDLTDSSLPEHDDSNNVYQLDLPLFFFENDTVAAKPATEGTARRFTNTGNQLIIDGSYNKGYGDASKFKVAVDLAGSLTLDLLGVGTGQGAVAEAGGSVDMWIFNAQNTIFGISFNGQAYTSGLNTGYESEMIIFNTTVFEDENYVAQFSKTFEKSWEERRVLASTTFTVGPIPIKIEAGLDGSVGFEFTIAYASKLTAGGDIFSTNFGGFANGGVSIGLASAGVTIVITLLDNVLNLDSEANLALLDDGQVNPRIEYAFALTDEIDIISGKFGLYADVKGIKWCKKWGIPYPCGSKTTTYYLWLYQTPSVFNKAWTLYSKDGSISI